MDNIKKAYLELHFTVFLYGFTGILGKLISLNELPLVWWRMFLTAASFLIFLPMISKSIKKVNDIKLVSHLSFIGVLVALHWICFFGSIKYSNVSIALICFSTTTFFTAILEPIILKTKFDKSDIGLGLLIIPGMYLIVNGVKIEYLTGVVLGVLGALLATIFSILNKRIVHKMDSISITAIEMSSGWLILSLVMPVYFYYSAEANFLPQGWQDMTYLLILALVCTTLAFVLSMRVMKHLSAFVVNLTISLEPIYAIIMAFIIFNENKELSENFYWGALVILNAVFGHPVLNKIKKRQNAKAKP
jgi:drug/metabolite transporter (DMT)-like permease